jgi:hypothetical protein
LKGRKHIECKKKKKKTSSERRMKVHYDELFWMSHFWFLWVRPSLVSYNPNPFENYGKKEMRNCK